MANLYLLTQDVNNDYETYDSAVVCADSEQEAQRIHPVSVRYSYLQSNRDPWNNDNFEWADKPEQVKVQLIGTAHESIKLNTVIIGSFNAG